MIKLQNYVVEVLPDQMKLHPDLCRDDQRKAAQNFLGFPVSQVTFTRMCKTVGLKFPHKKGGPKEGSKWKQGQAKNSYQGRITALEKRLDELEKKVAKRHHWHQTCFKQIYNALKPKKK